MSQQFPRQIALRAPFLDPFGSSVVSRGRGIARTESVVQFSASFGGVVASCPSRKPGAAGATQEPEGKKSGYLDQDSLTTAVAQWVRALRPCL
jgi:hypothetical protein